MWVKICGNTNLEDAALAAALGADAVGFVFAASKRQVTATQVAAITPHLPAAVERVGVFDSRDPDLIANAVRVAGLSAVQLHGGLNEELVDNLSRTFGDTVRIIQTLHWSVDGDSHAESAVELMMQIKRVADLGIADRVLVDSRIGSAVGGTGVAFDWSGARETFASATSGIHLVLAGGLKPANVADAIRQLAPWGVDVSSGVEAAPGRKDPQRLARFIENARAAATP
jgi:phosphoribosylanthranilate isomerase